MDKKTENNFWTSKMGRWAIIGISYLSVYLVMWFFSEIATRSNTASTFGMIMVIACAVLAVPVTNKVVNYVNNAIFGNLILFGPLQMFLEIFLVKLVLRIVIAFIAGVFVAPFTIGNFIANRLGAAK